MATIIFKGILKDDEKKSILQKMESRTWGYIQGGNYCLQFLDNGKDAYRIVQMYPDKILSVQGLSTDLLNIELEKLLNSIKFNGLTNYLQTWAKFNNFPKDFSIDYESLDKLDVIRNLLVNRNDVIDLILDYRNFAVAANAMNCISIKNVVDKSIYYRFKLLSYICATIGAESYESTKTIEICKYIRLFVMSNILDYLCEILDEMSNNGILGANYDELDYILMADCFSLENVDSKDTFYLEKQRQCKEKYKNYSFLSKEEIIKKGDEYHRMIKNFLLVSDYLNK